MSPRALIPGPLVEKRLASSGAVKTFEVVASEWHAFKLPHWATAKKGAAVQAQLYLNKDLVPALGRIPIADVKRADVLACLRVIEKRGALNVARKCRTWLNEIFRFGIASDYPEVNPASDLDIVAVKQPPEKHNPMLRQRKLKEFLAKLHEADIKDYTKSAIRILLLTAVRTGGVFRFHFPEHVDNSGFVGWLAMRLKRDFGTGVFVTCGQNRDEGGIFDYWGVPASLASGVFAEIQALVEGRASR